MTRRFDYGTAEKISLALLTRAAFGAEAGLRTGARLGVPSTLVQLVFSRFPIETRLDIAGTTAALDRRRPRPSNDEGE